MSQKPAPEEVVEDLRRRRWLFGDCRLDGATLELTVRGERVRLEPKPLQTLMFLLRHPGEVVTKDELYAEIWPGRILSDSVLAKCMARLRQGLGDEDQTIIKTVHGFGYRLVAPVTIEHEAAEVEPLMPELKVGDEPPGRPGWRLVARIDTGGHGDVWRVEHEQTHEARVFKFAQDAPGIAGLRREITLWRVLRESLGARRDLVRVIAWNLDEEPFFLESEYARGGSLLQWSERQGGLGAIPLARRLEFAAQTADALAAAHSAGVLHRDLKPGNILVGLDADQEPYVQLGDFGSGQMLDFERLRLLEITRMGFTQAIPDEDSGSATPLYLAPELLTGQQPTVQSDIYALGVVLYQLVVGDFRRLLAPGWEHDVADPLLCEDIACAGAGDPANRLSDAAELGRRLRTLEMRRAERAAAQAAAEEAASLRAALERARVRRRWALGLAVVFAFALGLTATALVVVRSARDAARAAGLRAEREAAEAQAVNRFLTDDLLGNASPLQSGTQDPRVSELVRRAESGVGSRFARFPGQEGPVRLALGRAYLSFGDTAAAERQLRGARAVAASEQLARIDLALAELEVARDRRPEAAALLATARKASAPQSEVDLLGRMYEAWLRNLAADYDRAIAELVALRAPFESTFGADHGRVTELLDITGSAMLNAGRYDEAIALLREAVSRVQDRLGPQDARTIAIRHSLGAALRTAERLDEAREVLLDVRSLARRTLGDDHLLSITAAIELALVYELSGDTAQARAIDEDALQRAKTHLGAEHVRTLELMNNLAGLYSMGGEPVRGIGLLQDVVTIRERVLGPDDEETVIAMHNLALAHADARDWSRAEFVQSTALARARRAFADHYLVGILEYAHAESLGRLGRYDEADPLFDGAIRHLTATLGPDNPRIAIARRLQDEMRRRRVPGG